jgi:hypothetical protein
MARKMSEGPNSAEWRKERDSNPRNRFRFSGFQDRRIRPLCHPSREWIIKTKSLVIRNPVFLREEYFGRVALEALYLFRKSSIYLETSSRFTEASKLKETNLASSLPRLSICLDLPISLPLAFRALASNSPSTELVEIK